MPIYNPPAAGGGGGTITTKDEGSTLSSTVNTIDFVGAGITATGSGATTTVTVPGAAGASWSETEVDFGTSPGVTEKTFIITDAGVTGSSKVIVVQSGNAATSRASGDALWDGIMYAATPGTGQFTLYATTAQGPVSGRRKVFYTVA